MICNRHSTANIYDREVCIIYEYIDMVRKRSVVTSLFLQCNNCKLATKLKKESRWKVIIFVDAYVCMSCAEKQ